MKNHAQTWQLVLVLGLALGVIAPSWAAPQAPVLVYSFPTTANSGTMLGTVAIGNVDNDPALEIVVNSPAGIHIYDYDGTLVSSFDTNNGTLDRQVNAAPTLADVDGDGRQEVIFATAYSPSGDYVNTNSAFAINGEDGSVAWEMPITLNTYSQPDSGYQTIAGKFYYDGAEHDQLPPQTTFTAIASAVPVYDIDGDGRLEAIVNLKIRPEPTQDYNPYINDIWGFAEFGTVGESWSGGNFILDASSGDRDYIYHFLQLNEAGLALGVVDEALGTAVFSLTDSDSVVGYHKTAPHGFYGAGNLIGQFGKNSRIQSGSYKKSTTLNAVDLTGDGKAEVLYEGHNIADLLWRGSSVIFDHAGRIIWREWYDFPETSGLANIWPNAAQMIPLNLDGGDPEIVSWHHTNQLFYESWDGVQLVSKGGAWPVSFGSEFPSPPAVGDVDGDGQEEFVIARYDPVNLEAAGGLTVLAQDGSVEQTLPTPRGVKNIPNLYDVDQDGDLDIIARDLAGTIYVFDTQSGDPGKVSWASEYRSAARTGALGMKLYGVDAPLVGPTTEGYEHIQLTWSIADSAGLSGFEIYRKRYGEADYALIASPGVAASQFNDTAVENGQLYVYKVVAVRGSAKAWSAPIPAVPLMENNLVRNSAMELDGDHSWDKWYTGDIPWEDMTRTTTQAYQGTASMRIHLANQGENMSISQWNQYGVPDAHLPVTPGQLYSLGAFIRTHLNQASQQFIEWTSSYNRYRHDPTNDPIPLPEYPNYFSTIVNAPAGESGWWYTNRTFIVQEGVTAIAPRHRYYLDSASTATGDVYLDNVFLRAVGSEAGDALTLLPFESTWRYLEGTPPAGWYAADFDDSAWASGQAKFGVGSGPQNVNTTLPSYKDRFFFRTTFNFDTDLSEWVAYALATTGPNGGAGIKDIYINGQYLPIQDPGLSGGQGNDVRHLDLSPFIHLLLPGENVVAIKLENEYKINDWDDVAFDFQLKGVVAQAPGLQAVKSASSLTPGVEDVVSYTIRLDNPGPARPGVWVTDTLPAGLSSRGDLWASSGDYSEVDGTILWHGSIPAGGQVLITFSTDINSPGTAAFPVVNTAWVDDGQGNIQTCRATIMVNSQVIYLPLVSKRHW